MIDENTIRSAWTIDIGHSLSRNNVQLLEFGCDIRVAKVCRRGGWVGQRTASKSRHTIAFIRTAFSGNGY